MPQKSDQAAAILLVDIFITVFGLRAGQSLSDKALATSWARAGRAPDAFAAGLFYGLERGWIEPVLKARSRSHRLLAAGVEELRAFPTWSAHELFQIHQPTSPD